MPSFQHFQAFTIKFSGRTDRIITDVGVSVAFDAASPPTPMPQMVPSMALWDTGASRSVISSALVTQLGLTPTGVVNVNHAGGSSKSNTYVVNFGLPNKVGIAGVLVTEFPGDPQFGAIVGMDIIAMGDFALTHVAGLGCMSFRVPSCAVVDYVHEANRIVFSGVGRNDPCPCGKKRQDGTRLKYKQCHGLLPKAP